MLSKQKTQPDGDEEPCQYGLCCDACRAEGRRHAAPERWRRKRVVRPVVLEGGSFVINKLNSASDSKSILGRFLSWD